jgi:ketosteroid isomerase-like protein
LNAVDELLAYEQIRQLAARYALAVDSRDLDALSSLFTGDVRASFAQSLRGVGITILNIGTHVIDIVDATHATGVVYCKGEIQDGDRWIHQAILYRDTYEQRDGRWLFVRRVHELWYGAEVGTNPLGLPAANWPEHHDGLGTVPESFATWREFWSET